MNKRKDSESIFVIRSIPWLLNKNGGVGVDGVHSSKNGSPL